MKFVFNIVYLKLWNKCTAGFECFDLKREGAFCYIIATEIRITARFKLSSGQQLVINTP